MEKKVPFGINTTYKSLKTSVKLSMLKFTHKLKHLKHILYHSLAPQKLNMEPENTPLPLENVNIIFKNPRHHFQAQNITSPPLVTPIFNTHLWKINGKFHPESWRFASNDFTYPTISHMIRVGSPLDPLDHPVQRTRFIFNGRIKVHQPGAFPNFHKPSGPISLTKQTTTIFLGEFKIGRLEIFGRELS